MHVCIVLWTVVVILRLVAVVLGIGAVVLWMDVVVLVRGIGRWGAGARFRGSAGAMTKLDVVLLQAASDVGCCFVSRVMHVVMMVLSRLLVWCSLSPWVVLAMAAARVIYLGWLVRRRGGAVVLRSLRVVMSCSTLVRSAGNGWPECRPHPSAWLRWNSVMSVGRGQILTVWWGVSGLGVTDSVRWAVNWVV